MGPLSFAGPVLYLHTSTVCEFVPCLKYPWLFSLSQLPSYSHYTPLPKTLKLVCIFIRCPYLYTCFLLLCSKIFCVVSMWQAQFQHFIWICSVLRKIPVIQTSSSSLFSDEETESQRGYNNLPKVTQLVNHEDEPWTQAF